MWSTKKQWSTIKILMVLKFVIVIVNLHINNIIFSHRGFKNISALAPKVL